MAYANDLVVTSCQEQVNGTVPNSGGGCSFPTNDMERLRRFLILGHEGGTYYATSKKLTYETIDCLDRLLEINPSRVINTIVNVSESGIAPKNDAAIFALAYVVSKKEPYSQYALSKIKQVCRTGTHLFDFLNACKSLNRGWGQAFKKNVASWYSRPPQKLAHLVTKYAQRNSWSHRDVLRKCHPNFPNPGLNTIFQYITQHEKFVDNPINSEVWNYLNAVDECKNPSCCDKHRIKLIHEFRLVREHLPTASLNNPAIWEALLPNMPGTALLRNLGKMTNVGLLTPLSEASSRVYYKLVDSEFVRRQRLHPISILLASKTYASGSGYRGSLTWTPISSLVDALNGAFYNSFHHVLPTGQRLMLAIDVSGSMRQPCNGSPILSAREAAAAMALTTVRTETRVFTHAFSSDFIPLNLSPMNNLNSILQQTANLPFMRTDCSLPMRYARENNLQVDVFCIYTDNETNCGNHPYVELEKYREASGIKAKCAVFGFTNTDFSIANPNDAGMMDFVGFDASAPVLLNNFIQG